jgi:hypothetical protein
VARANYEVASQSQLEVCELAYQTIMDPSLKGWSLYPPYMEHALEQTRARQLELLRKNALELRG